MITPAAGKSLSIARGEYAGRTPQGKALRDHSEPVGTMAQTRTPLSIVCPLCAQHCPELTFVWSRLILTLAL